ncbi:MAG: hypothetical protein ACYTHJ_07830 [Planctomycetota bacterium]
MTCAPAYALASQGEVLVLDHPNAFSGNERVIAFEDLPGQTLLRKQYQDAGVRFLLTSAHGARVGVTEDPRMFPPQGHNMVTNLPPEGFEELPNIDIAFDSRVTRVGFELRSVHGDPVSFMLYGFDGAKIIWRKRLNVSSSFVFFGFESTQPFNALHFDVEPNVRDAFMLDNLRFEYGVPSPPECHAGGPYHVECRAGTVMVPLDSSGVLGGRAGQPETYHWSSDCPGANLQPAADAVSPVLIFDTPAPCAGITCRLWLTAANEHGSVSCETEIHVTDTTPPRISCQPDLVAASPDRFPNTDLGATAVDNCGEPSISLLESRTNGGLGCPDNPRVTTFHYRATDAAGNSSQCSSRLTVADDQPPEQVFCPPDVAIGCLSHLPKIDIDAVTVVEASDSVAVTHVGDTYDKGTGCPGSPMQVFREYKATDACGNAKSCIQKIRIVDESKPLDFPCPEDLSLECRTDIPRPHPESLEAFDLCGPVTLRHAGDIPNTGTGCPQDPLVISRLYRAADSCDNHTDCVQTITIVDAESPTSIACPPNMTVECADDIPAIDLSAIIASDRCGKPSVELLAETGNGGSGCADDPLILTRQFRAADACGNSITCAQTITVQDPGEPLRLACPDDINVSCMGEITEADVALVKAPTACDSTEIRHLGDLDNGGSGCPNDPLVIRRIYVGTASCARRAQCIQTITVSDMQPPDVQTCGSARQFTCGSELPVASIQDVLATDNCGDIDVAHVVDRSNDGDGCPGRPGIVERVFRVTDTCGNESLCEVSFTISDETPPDIACPDDLEVFCDDEVPGENLRQVLSTDQCHPVQVDYEGDVVESDGCVTWIRRKYVSSDLCGNESRCEQNIRVRDAVPPMVVCPADLEVAPDGPTEPSQTGSPIDYDDNCGIVTIVHSDCVDETTRCPVARTITRTWTAADPCGNLATCEQRLLVQCDEAPPVSNWGMTILMVLLVTGANAVFARHGAFRGRTLG